MPVPNPRIGIVGVLDHTSDGIPLVWPYSNARIADAAMQRSLAGSFRQSAHAHQHLSRTSEFDGIADQVQQDQPQAAGISNDRARNVRSEVADQFKILLAGSDSECLYGALNRRSQIERNAFQIRNQFDKLFHAALECNCTTSAGLSKIKSRSRAEMQILAVLQTPDSIAS
jgi:hypothetical protein